MKGQRGKTQQVELLAPAGSYEALIGAFSAGADAVYFGADRFGARAAAQNFTHEEILSAIRYARLLGKRLYLTVNTLVKEAELADIVPFLAPYAAAGLHGVIVQDYGVLSLIRKAFPALAVHASTQMAITGSHGARALKAFGVRRVVPARELTLPELKRLKEASGIEVEVFVHGAMCYCYSGMCLFSGVIGGRSGNRGRCGQACRLPYDISGASAPAHPLSLKDLCTLDDIPALIGAGADSFKIEGRMKKPEYAAGVTAIYRKYIDRFYAAPDAYRVEAEDLQKLHGLYLRSEISDGYLHRHNGAEMVTKGMPGYLGTDDALLAEIRDRYLREGKRLPVSVFCSAHAGKPVVLTFQEAETGARVTVTGAPAETAKNRPMREAEIAKPLAQLGDGFFAAKDVRVETDGEGVFVPVGALKRLRREAEEALAEAVLQARADGEPSAEAVLQARADGEIPAEEVHGAVSGAGAMSPEKRKETPDTVNGSPEIPENRTLPGAERGRASATERKPYDIAFRTGAQLAGIIGAGIRAARLYPDAALFLEEEAGADRLLDSIADSLPGCAVFPALPYITREETAADLDDLRRLLSLADRDRRIGGFLVRNAEAGAFLRGEGYTGRIVADHGLYVWNSGAWELLLSGGLFAADEITLPLELSERDLCRMQAASGQDADVQNTSMQGTSMSGAAMQNAPMQNDSVQIPSGQDAAPGTREHPCSLVVYGRAPMMVSAGCVYRTGRGCPGTRGRFVTQKAVLTDRKRHSLPVTCDCRLCYNVIWNAYPLSLHAKMERIAERFAQARLRLEFTTEDENGTRQAAAYYEALRGGKKPPEPLFAPFTAGRFQESVQ